MQVDRSRPWNGGIARQTERVCHWYGGLKSFRLFLLGSKFDVITDHKALEAI